MTGKTDPEATVERMSRQIEQMMSPRERYNVDQGQGMMTRQFASNSLYERNTFGFQTYRVPGINGAGYQSRGYQFDQNNPSSRDRNIFNEGGNFQNMFRNSRTRTAYGTARPRDFINIRIKQGSRIVDGRPICLQVREARSHAVFLHDSAASLSTYP